MNKTTSENKTEFTLSIPKANFYSLLMIIPITAIYLIPFIMIWDFKTFDIGRKEFLHLFLYMFVFGIIIHEFLHGITWLFFTQKGLKSIQFGLNGLTPYCHCKEPLKVKHYKLGGAMPLIVMGIIPSLTGLIWGNGLFLCVGIFFSWTAGGDILSLFMLRKFDRNKMVYDHPNKMGFYIQETNI